MAILRIKDKNGVWQEIPAIVGRKGDDGDKGDSITVKSFTPSTQDGGDNVVVFSDNTRVVVKNGNKGSQGINATINGYNVLNIEADSGIGITMEGNTMKLHLTIEGVASTLINRSTAVNVSDENYSTLMARGTSLNFTETTPDVNGAICWQYK